MASSTNMLRSAVRLFLLSLTLVWTQGFQYQTSYIQDNIQNSCDHNVSDITGEVQSHRGTEETTYQSSLDCSITINAQPGKRINIRFDFFDLSSTYQKTVRECKSDADRVYIYDTGKLSRRGGDRSAPKRTLCGGTGEFPADYQSPGNVVTLRFISDSTRTEDKGFKFIYTQFVPKTDEATDCFSCEDDDDMCISEELLCNDINNCNDNSDESDTICQAASEDVLFGVFGVGVVAIVAGTLGVVFLIVIVICIVCCCRLRRGNNSKANNANSNSRPSSYPNQSPVPRYASQAPPPLPPPPSTSPYPPHMYQMYNGHGPPHHHPGPGVMYHHSHESVDLPQKI